MFWFYKFNAGIIPDISLVDSVVIEPPYIHRKRQATEYILYLIKKGSMYLKENGREFQLESGDMCILDPEFTHEGTRTSWCEYYYIHFRHPDMVRLDGSSMPDYAQMLLDNRQEAMQSNMFSYDPCGKKMVYLPKQLRISNYHDYLRVICLLNEAIEQNKMQMEGYKVLCACRVEAALIELARSFVTTEIKKQFANVPKSHQTVQDILSFLNAEYASDITSGLLEDKFGGNFDYMNRVFKKVTGNTIFKYLTEVRINHARVLLNTTSIKVAQVGADVGFPDEYYFSRVFKKHTGVSPAGYSRGIGNSSISSF